MNTEKIIENVFTEVEDGINAEVKKLTVKCIDSTNRNFSLDCEGNLSVNSISTRVPITLPTSIIDIIYPIGTYYETSDDNFNPNVTWTGTWKLDSQGLVTVSQDVNQIEFNTLGTTGGSKFLQRHHHDVRYSSPEGSGVTISYTGTGERALDITNWSWTKNVANEFGSSSNLKTCFSGIGNAGNLQPYIVVKRWHRVA